MNTSAAMVLDKSGKMIGEIADRTFIKYVSGAKHMLRKPMAWAIDADIFDRVIAPNCLSIHVVDRNTHTRYIVGVKTFRDKHHETDRGYGKQYYLELVHWQTEALK